MKKILIGLTMFSLIISCSNFEGKKYWDEENNAIVDLIPEMVDAEYMLANNEYETEKPTIIIIDNLFNELKILEYDSVSNIDRKGLKPLTSKQMKSRKLTLNLLTKLKHLNVKLI